MSSRNRAGPAAAMSHGLGRASAAALLLALAACHPSPRVAPLSPPARSAVIDLQHQVDAVLADLSLQHTSWGVLVRSLKSDDTLYSRNSDKLMMPASNLKIVTLAAAAERLGWDYTYETRLLATGSVNDNVLEGDLRVVGSGDPTIGPEGPGNGVFDAWAEQLKAAGIRTISGRIIGDDNAFDDEILGPGWAWDYLAEGYATGVSALQFNENVVWMTAAPAARVGDTATVSLSSPHSGLEIRNGLQTGPTGAAASIVARRLPGSARLELRGSIPQGAPVVRSLAVVNPTLFFVDTFRATLVAHGIDVQGPAVDIDDLVSLPSSAGAVQASHRSAPLASLAVRMMKASQNLYAETLLKTLGAATGVPSVAGGRDAAIMTVQSWGVTPGELVMIDGSGLSRYNLIAPATLVTILTHVDRDERLRAPFEEALPVAGKDGTLESRMKGTPAENNARAKSGSIANARTLSGYVNTADGEPLVFSILANNFETAADVIDRATDAIVVLLAKFRR